ncbi:MAG: GlsB/YeaQ/YmgE family stress response membrane protein, partial [Dermatophilaceae bacterium]
NINLLITTIIGIVGALIGWWIAGLLGVQQTGGVDWIRWIISIVVAAIGVVAYGAPHQKNLTNQPTRTALYPQCGTRAATRAMGVCRRR